MKIAIVTDSNSGITQKQGSQQGIAVLPMPFIINNQTFSEELDFTREDFYHQLEDGAQITTSQPSPANVTNLWDHLLKDHDQIVHIPMSSGLSSAAQTAAMLAEDYDGKVVVVNNQRISVTQRQAVLDARAMADHGCQADEIRKKLEDTKFDSTIYVTLDTLKYLKKGGRITPAAAALGTLLKIKPILTIQGEKLDAFAKTRTLKQAKAIMTAAIKKDLEERFDDLEARNTWLYVVHGNCEAEAFEYREELKAAFPDTSEIYVDHISLSVACHVGPGTLAVACAKKLSEG